MTLKGFLCYSLLTNAALVGAVLWQERIRADVVELEQTAAIDEDVIFREYVLAELASEDPERIDDLERLCHFDLAKLKPRVATIWDGTE